MERMPECPTAGCKAQKADLRCLEAVVMLSFQLPKLVPQNHILAGRLPEIVLRELHLHGIGNMKVYGTQLWGGKTKR